MRFGDLPGERGCPSLLPFPTPGDTVAR
jgi:hypothetical protein